MLRRCIQRNDVQGKRTIEPVMLQDIVDLVCKRMSISTQFARLKKVQRCEARRDAAIVFWTTLNLRD